MEKATEKTKVTFYLSTETVEQIRELSFFLRQPRSSLIEQMIADAYRRWKEEQSMSNEKKESQPQSEENPYA